MNKILLGVANQFIKSNDYDLLLMNQNSLRKELWRNFCDNHECSAEGYLEEFCKTPNEELSRLIEECGPCIECYKCIAKDIIKNSGVSYL